MASGSGSGADAGSSLKETLKKFATKGDGKELTSKDMSRWCTDAGVFKGSKTCTTQNLDIAFSAVKPKGKPTITEKELGPLIAKISKQYAKDHKISDEEAEVKLTAMLAGCDKAAHGTTKISKTGGVAKMTDASQYTGAHKERFDADGKGKGIEGRADVADNSGYVGNYKGSGSYEKKE